MKYDEYMASAKWRQRRESFFFEHRRICQGCRTRARDAEMELHHVSYAHIGHEQDDELAALCNRCHEQVHSREKDMLLIGRPTKNRAEAIRLATVGVVTIPSSETLSLNRPIWFYTDANGNLAFMEDNTQTKKLRSIAEAMREAGLGR